MSTFAVLALPLHGSATFGAFIKCYHKPFFFFFLLPPSEQHSYICKKNFSSGARAPLRQHRAACLMRSRCEETWEAEMLLESLSHSVNWCLQLANAESWNTWVFLFYFLSFFFSPSGSVWCLVSSQGPCCFYTWCHGATLSPGKLIRWAPDEVWTVKKQHRRVLFVSVKAVAPSG